MVTANGISREINRIGAIRKKIKELVDENLSGDPGDFSFGYDIKVIKLRASNTALNPYNLPGTGTDPNLIRPINFAVHTTQFANQFPQIPILGRQVGV